VGLIGGSLGFALKKHSLVERVLGVSSAKTTAEAIRLGAIDEAVTLEEAAARADVLVLAQPVSVIIRTLETLPPTPALVTDVGSTKQAIVRAGARLPQFLGGHPMAGKETSGVGVAVPDLFEKKPWILTPVGELTPAGEEWFRMLKAIGAEVALLQPGQHDDLVALSSHLPQLLSTALAAAVEPTEAHRTAGPGLHDMTRLAMSNYDTWRDILATNEPAIRQALDLAIAQLTSMRERLPDDSLREDFARARRLAQRVRGE